MEVLLAFSWGAAVLRVLQLQERPTWQRRHGLSRIPPPVSAPLGPALRLPPFLHIPPGAEIQCFDIHVFSFYLDPNIWPDVRRRASEPALEEKQVEQTDQRESAGLLPCNDAEGHIKGYLIIPRSDLLLS